MKIILAILCKATLVTTAFAAPAQNTPVTANNSQTLSAGEKQLLETAGNASFNALVDSTDVSPQLPVSQATPYKNPIDNLNVQAQEFQFSALPLNSNNFLFWKEPDQQQIAQAVRAGQGYGPEQGTLPWDKLIESINTFLKNRGEPDEDADNGIYKFKLAELPEDLKQQLAAQFFLCAMQEAAPSYLDLWQSEALWQNANIYYVPANPGFMYSMQSLFAVSNIRTPNGSQELQFNLLSGGAYASPISEQNKAGQLKADEIQVFPLISNQDKNKSAIVPYPLRAAGSAAAAVTSIIPPLSQNDPNLKATVSIDAVRLPLVDLIARMATQTNTNLSITPEVTAKHYYVAVKMNNMPLHDAMTAVARLYDLSWKREADNSYRVEQTTHSAFQTTLHRVGDLQWYLFRENSSSADKARTAAFNELAARVVDEAGQEILKYPGVPFSSLTTETQQSLRDGVKSRLHRNVLSKQVNVLSLLGGEWSFTYKPRQGSLILNVGEKPTQALSFPILPPA